MKKNTMWKISFVAESAIIAAIYAMMTLVLAPVSFGPVQFRLSEALCILPVFMPSAIPGLTVGCFIANFVGSSYPLDLIFGTLATLIASILTRKFRNKRIKNLPVISSIFPVIVNAVIIGIEICFSANAHKNMREFTVLFFSSAGTIALGEFVCCCIIGLFLYKAITKTEILKKFNR